MSAQTYNPGDVNDIARRVARALMYATSLPVPDLASELHLHRVTLQKRLRGTVPFSSAEIEHMARLFGQRIDAFYTGRIDLTTIPEGLTPGPGEAINSGWFPGAHGVSPHDSRKIQRELVAA